MKTPIGIPDNQNRFTGGYRLKASPREVKALEKLSALTIWDLIESEPVLFMSSSFGSKDLRNKDRKFLEIEKNTDTDDVIVYTENVMGFLSVEGQHIQIYSRFDSRGHENIEKGKSAKDYFLMHMLSKVCGVSHSILRTGTGNEHSMDLYSLFFPKLLKDALRQGVFRSYRKYEHNDMKVKGQIDVVRHLRDNMPFNGSIAYSSREYDSDNYVTQLIRHTIEYLKTKPIGQQLLSRDTETRAATLMIIQATPTYCAKQFASIIQQNIAKRVSHPYYYKYIQLQQLCVAILQHKKASYGINQTKQIQGILFDGAWLWEEYLAVILKEQFKHYTCQSAFHLFESEGKPFQEIIPDYLSLEENANGGKMAVADAKYMVLLSDHLPAERACAVYYKTIMYMFRFKADKGFLFHPVLRKAEAVDNDLFPDEESIIVSDYTIVDRPDCHLYKMGLVVSNDAEEETFTKKKKVDDYWKKYCETMKYREAVFVDKIDKLIKSSASTIGST